jgi:polycomb protein EED
VFGGHVGHRDTINTISWHSSGTKFASGGQDTTVKIWELSTKVQDAISLSHEIASETGQQIQTNSDRVKKYAIDVVLEQFPIFSSGKLHVQRLNCVHFVGDLIVSKAALESFLKIWHPQVDNSLTFLGTRKVEPVPCEATLLRKFPLANSDTWFRRFAVDDSLELLAAGNDSGKVFVWDMGHSTTRPVQRLQLKLGKKVLPSSVVNLSFSPDRSMLVATTETGELCRFDIQQQL